MSQTQFNPETRAYRENPYPALAELRARAIPSIGAPR